MNFTGLLINQGKCCDVIFFSFVSCLVIQMPHLKNSNKGTMYALYVVKKWPQAVKNYHAITYSTQAAYALGFKGSKHVQHVEWMYLDLSPHHSLSSRHPHKLLSPLLASIPWGFLLRLWEFPLPQGYHPKVYKTVRTCWKWDSFVPVITSWLCLVKLASFFL